MPGRARGRGFGAVYWRPDGRWEAVFGVTGGQYQPQGHVQVVVNLLDHGMGPQAALDAAVRLVQDVGAARDAVEVRVGQDREVLAREDQRRREEPERDASAPQQAGAGRGSRLGAKFKEEKK